MGSRTERARSLVQPDGRVRATSVVNDRTVGSADVTGARSLDVRGALAALIATARRIPARRLTATAVAIGVLVAVVWLVRLPNAVQLRDWAQTLGPWFALAFLAAHAVITVFPFPRTAFTLAAGLLFGPWLGIGLAVAASTCSALAVLVLMRGAGWRFGRWLHHPGLTALDARLQRRGWPAVVSLRFIPAIPFAVINYAAGASAVRTLPYLLATLAGLLPGTAAVVVLGDALTGRVSPTLFAVSAATAAVGVAMLAVEVRGHRRDTASAPTSGDRPDAEPAGR